MFKFFKNKKAAELDKEFHGKLAVCMVELRNWEPRNKAFVTHYSDIVIKAMTQLNDKEAAIATLNKAFSFYLACYAFELTEVRESDKNAYKGFIQNYDNALGTDEKIEVLNRATLYLRRGISKCG